jgi:decaprenylphospho-beta-D-ribofuranose 2-oxidase
LLSGWGRTSPTAATVLRAEGPEDVDRASVATPRGLIARGLGRAYGDAAQNAGGVVLDTEALDLLDTDALADRGVVRCGAGVSIARLLAQLVPEGWVPPVMPGTASVTIGGAIAADVHGKNHHADGSFSAHIERLALWTPAGIRQCGPGDPVFAATAGGMGLTGVVLEAELRMRPVQTAWMRTSAVIGEDLEAVMAGLADADRSYRYSVAWIDVLARGRRLGRGVLDLGDHAALDDLAPDRRSSARAYAPGTLGRVPFVAPRNLLHPAAMRAFNQLWFARARMHRDGLTPLWTFFHPLDGLAAWNRLYGPGGLVQYQFVVPLAADRVVKETIELLAARRAPVFLAVLKRFGPSDGGPLSFPCAGWTLALDMPARARDLPALLRDLDARVAEAGGRVYLAKDARLSPGTLRIMYPRLAEWQAIRAQIDPERMLASDLARRLELVAP